MLIIQKTLASCLIFLTCTSMAQDLSPASILEKSAVFTREASTLSLDFSLQMTFELTGEENVSVGKLLVGEKDRFRLATSALVMVSDGIDLWQYNPATRQVQVRALLDLESGLHPTEVLFRYLRCKAISVKKGKLEGKRVYHLVLDPKGELNTLEGLDVWLDPGDFHPVQLQTRDVGGNLATYSIRSVVRNPELTDSDFTFEVPTGVEVIDMR